VKESLTPSVYGFGALQIDEPSGNFHFLAFYPFLGKH